MIIIKIINTSKDGSVGLGINKHNLFFGKNDNASGDVVIKFASVYMNFIKYSSLYFFHKSGPFFMSEDQETIEQFLSFYNYLLR